MQYSMAIRADGPKIVDGINLMLFADLGERSQVMDVDDSIGLFSVRFTEREVTNATICSIFFNAYGACAWVALILVGKHSDPRAFLHYLQIP